MGCDGVLNLCEVADEARPPGLARERKARSGRGGFTGVLGGGPPRTLFICDPCGPLWPPFPHGMAGLNGGRPKRGAAPYRGAGRPKKLQNASDPHAVWGGKVDHRGRKFVRVRGGPHQGRPPRARSYCLRGVVLLSRRRSGSVQVCILVRTWGCVFVGPLGGHGGGGPLGLYFRATPVPRTAFLDVGCVFGSVFRPFLPPLGLRGAQGELTFESKSHHTLVVRVFPTGVADQVETEGAPPTMPSGRGRFSA